MTERNPEHTRHYDRTLNGVTVNVWARPKSCFFCEHCTDMFVDLDGSPYLWFCELEKDIDDGMYERCENFKDDNFDMRGRGMTREDKYTRDVKGYEGLYKVNALGEVFSVKRNKLLSETVDKHGYVKYCLTKDGKHRQIKAHRIVAEAFIPNPQNKREVNHIDGDKSNNAVWNLEWTTTSENARHSVRVGLRTQCKSVRIVETGEVFPSLGECARAIGGDVGNISRCLNTNKSDTHKGFHFERVV